MKSGSRKLASIAPSLILILPCCLCLYFSFISYPSTETIANRYLNAVISGDLETATGLARSNKWCQNSLRDSALKDIDQFSGSEVRHVVIEVQGNTGSDDELQFAKVQFEYRQRDQVECQHGEMMLATDHEVPGLRYLCGNTLSGR